ncbi:unnamed protein product [Closterium sp. NIES-65]|nr:unnamed protein product [Closterium sp. NIES-65]
MNNHGRINSPGNDIRVAMAKNASKAGSPTAASGASCDGDDGDEANADDAEEDWPENGHDDSASGDELGPADIEEDDWWNRPVESDDEVEEWRAGDSDNDRARYARWFMREGIHLKTKKGNLRRPLHPVVLQWIVEAWDQVPKQIIIDAFRHCGISSKLDRTENHLVMSHLRARSTTDISADMSLGGTTGDNTRLLGRAPEEEEEEAMQAEGVREVAMATGLEVLYQETPNYRGAVAEADHMIEPRETARHAWRVPDLGVEPVVSAGEEAVTEGG